MRTQRQPLLDVFRGFAIFGIFVVNITIMHSVLMYQDAYNGQFTGAVTEFITKLLQLFFYNKFFPIFSFLFGLGLSMQMQSKINSGKGYVGFFCRRMALLFVFGLGHIVLLWSGDVLHLYAMLGLLCLVFIKLDRRVLVAVAILLLVFPYYDSGAMWLSGLFTPALESGLLNYGDQGLVEAIRKGSYLAGVDVRLDEYAANLPMLLFYLAPMALAMFLLGIAAGKGEYKFGSQTWLVQTKTLAITTLVLTSVYRFSFLWLMPGTELYSNEVLRPVWFKLMFLSDVTFGLFYLWAIAWCWHKNIGVKLLSPFSYVGRMALTNYLMQSLVGLVLFTSVGFALYQTLSPLMCFVLAVAIFSVQILFSKVWLTHFRFGPLEWLWRCGSYLSLFIMRRGRGSQESLQQTEQ